MVAPLTLALIMALTQVPQNPSLTWSTVPRSRPLPDTPSRPLPLQLRTSPGLPAYASPAPIGQLLNTNQSGNKPRSSSCVLPSCAVLGLRSHVGPALSLTPPTSSYLIHQPSSVDRPSLHVECVLSSPSAPGPRDHHLPSGALRWPLPALPASMPLQATLLRDQSPPATGIWILLPRPRTLQ